MADERWDGNASRGIRQRVVVEGDLILLTPVHLGNGDGDALVDLPLITDPLDGRPLLPGTTLAGALRDYLRARELGDRAPTSGTAAERDSWAARLFGAGRADESSEQSPLIVDDAFASNAVPELRDGVALDPVTRTAADGKKFDLELWPAGTTFALRFELLLGGDRAVDDLRRRALATALDGLTSASGGIRFGARKHRGYGQVTVEHWRVTRYDLTTPAGLIAWIASDGADAAAAASAPTVEGPGVAALLDVPLLPDRRRWLQIEATFALDGSLLIRAGSANPVSLTGSQPSETGSGHGVGGPRPGDERFPETVVVPDAEHLHARQRDEQSAPILSGTSLAGAIRARAGRIAATLAPGSPRARRLIDGVFGNALGSDEDAVASRLIVDERGVASARTDLVQSRVAIDRVTGGAAATALFSEQPVFGSAETTVSLGLRLANPTPYEAGLLLLVLKDLWTSDLPLGGEIGVGRGRLRGREARVQLATGGAVPERWSIAAQDGHLAVTGPRGDLEGFVRALTDHLTEEHRG